MQRYAFSIHLTPESEGGYSVTCPALPGCYSQGETIDDAIANIREAIALTIEDMVAHGESVSDAV